MNIPNMIKKLMLGLQVQGRLVKIDTRTFYAQKSKRFVKKLTLYGQEKEKWKELWSGYSQVELLKYLADYYKEGEANG